MNTPNPSHASLTAYYRWHARIYDLTRWAFLFGRSQLIHKAAYRVVQPARILEVGCGTGRNLVALAQRFPAARITRPRPRQGAALRFAHGAVASGV